MTINAQRNITEKTITIGDRKFGTRGNPIRRLISQFPGKVTFGDYNNQSNPIASVKTWSDRRGGVGVENGDIEIGQDRTWFSQNSLRHNKHHVLQRLAVATADNADIGTDDTVQFVAELSDEVYSIAGDKIYRYSNAADSWSGSLRSFAATPTDVTSAPVNGVQTLVVAQSGAGVDFSTDGSSWTDESGGTDIAFITWDVARGFLWGIDTVGNTYFTSNLASGWTLTATLKLTRGQPTRLFIGPGPTDDDLLYAATQIGLYVYDNANARWVPTKLTLPFHDQNGTGTAVFRESIFVNAGLAVYKYTPDTQTVVTLIGPDRDDGIPQLYQGSTQALVGTHTELHLMIDGADTASTSEDLDFTFTDGLHRSITLGGGAGVSSIMGWNELGWEWKWTNPTAGAVTTSNMLVSNAYNSYRLWWGANETIFYMELPVGIENPNQVVTTQRAATGTTEEPWFDAGVDNQTKTALAFILDSEHPSSAETITLKYQLDFDESDSATRTILTKRRSGEQRVNLPSEENMEGVPFRAIRPIQDLARGNVLTATPDGKRLTLVFKKNLDTLWGWDVVVNLTRERQGYSPEQQRDFLEEIQRSKTLIPFTYKDEDDNDQNYFVFLLAAQAEEATGHNDAAFWRLTLAEANSG